MSSAITNKSNPYAAPEAYGREFFFYSPDGHVVCNVSRSWLYRGISFAGPTPLEIVYNGWGVGYESIFVNGCLVKRAYTNLVTYAPRIDFELRGLDRIYRAHVDVRLFLESFLSSFRLVIDDRVVYSEGSW